MGYAVDSNQRRRWLSWKVSYPRCGTCHPRHGQNRSQNQESDASLSNSGREFLRRATCIHHISRWSRKRISDRFNVKRLPSVSRVMHPFQSRPGIRLFTIRLPVARRGCDGARPVPLSRSEGARGESRWEDQPCDPMFSSSLQLIISACTNHRAASSGSSSMMLSLVTRGSPIDLGRVQGILSPCQVHPRHSEVDHNNTYPHMGGLDSEIPPTQIGNGHGVVPLICGYPR